MRKSLSALFRGILSVLLLAAGFGSCEIGLGASVDTESPSISITYPPLSATIRKTFTLAGTCSDDIGVTRVAVSIKDSSGNTTSLGDASISSDKTSWSISVNAYDANNSSYTNGWQFADGTYELDVTAYDDSGRASGTAARTYSIDNTAPVLTIINPSSAGGQTAATSFGREVKLVGAFSEACNSKIDKLIVDFYEEGGAFLHEASFDGIIDMSNSNPLVVAKYFEESAEPVSGDEDYEKWQNYKELYGSEVDNFRKNKSAAKKTYFFTVTAYDGARVYTDVSNTSGASDGNFTKTFYRGTTAMQKLIGGSYPGLENFTSFSLRNYLNGTDTSYAGNSTLETILAAAKSTSLYSESVDSATRSALTAGTSIQSLTSNNDTSVGNVYLKFCMNPKNNPTYSIGGMERSTTGGDSYSSKQSDNNYYYGYYSGSTVNLTLSAGLDGTSLDTSTITVYYTDITANDNKKYILWTWNKVAAIDYARQQNSAYENATDESVYASIAGTTDAAKSNHYTPTDSSQNDSSLQISTTIKDGFVSGHCYAFSISGQDINEQDIVEDSSNGYGFFAKTNEQAPSLTVTSGKDNMSVINADYISGGAFGYKGTVESTASLTGSEYVVDIDGTSQKGNLTISGNSSPYTWDFSLTPDSNLKSKISSEGLHTITVTINATNGGGTQSVTRTLYLDTKAPEVSNLSLSGDGVQKDSSATSTDSYFINTSEKFSLSGTSSDNYKIGSTTYSITGIASDGSAKTVTPAPSSSTEVSWSFADIDLKDFATQDNAPDAILTVTATDAAGNSHSYTVNLEFDTTAPVWKEDKSDSNENGIDFTVESSKTEEDWFKSAMLTVSGAFAEEGSGIATVYYWIMKPGETSVSYSDLSSATGSFSTSDQGSYETFSSKVGDFEENKGLTGNTIAFVAVDKVGNVSSATTKVIKIDQTSPSLAAKYYSFDGETYSSASGTVLANGKKDMTLFGTISDSMSGVSGISFSIGETAVTPTSLVFADADLTNVTTSDGYKDLEWKSTDAITYKTSISAWKAVFSASDINTSSGTVKATPVDIAGNSNSQEIFTLAVDNTSPVISLSASSSTYFVAGSSVSGGSEVSSGSDASNVAVATVNKSATFAGTASDDFTLSYVSAYYSLTDSSAAITENDKLIETVSGTKVYSWSFSQVVSDGIKMLSADSTCSTAVTSSKTSENLYIKILACDSAANQTVEVYKYTIDPNADRPVINVTNLAENDGAIMYQKTLTGTFSDDDGFMAMKVYEVTSSQTTPPKTSAEWESYHQTGNFSVTSSTGEWSYTPIDTSDGHKEIYIYFKDSSETEFWTAYDAYAGESDAETKNQVLMPYITYKGENKAALSSSLSFRPDNNPPTVGDVKIASSADRVKKDTIGESFSDSYKYYTKSGSTYTETSVGEDTFVAGEYYRDFVDSDYENASSGFVAGGINERYVFFKVPAADSNGIASISLEVTDSSSSLIGSASTDSSSESSDLLQVTEGMDLQSFASGTATLQVSVKDKSGLSSSSKPTFTLDNKGPSVYISAPSEKSELTGAVTLSGTSSDEGGSSIKETYFMVPSSSVRSLSDDDLAARSEWSNAYLTGYSGQAWKFEIDSEVMSTYCTNEYYTEKSDDTGIYTLPLYIKAVDSLGNYSIKNTSMLYNKDGDKPVTTISNPTVKETLLSGTMRVTGASVINLGSASVKGVYVQLAEITASSDGTVSYSANNFAPYSLSMTVPGGYAALDASAAGIAEFNTGKSGFTSDTKRSDWWGIKAENTSGSWYISLNENSELDPSDSDSGATRYIAVRACGVNSEGKVGNWTDPYLLEFDTSAPSGSVGLYKYLLAPTSNVTNSSLNITGEKIFTSNMYVRNKSSDGWYLTVKLLDNTGINKEKITVQRGSTTLTNGSGYFISSELSESPAGSATPYSGNYVYIPLTTSSGEVTYKVSAEDNDSGNPKTFSASYTINIDNTAPALTELKDGSGYALSKRKLANSNYTLTFAGTATDEGSGFDKLALYFTRTSDGSSSGTVSSIELPLPYISSANSGSSTTAAFPSAVATETSYVKTVYQVGTGSGQVSLDSESGLYGVTASGLTRDSATTLSYADAANYAFIRKGGMVRIGGSYFIIKDVSGSTITLDSSDGVDTSIASAFFPAAIIVEAGNSDSSSDAYTINESDGDGIVDYAKQSGSTYNWNLSLYSDILEDGPVNIEWTAFDVAGNAALSSEQNASAYVMLCNHAPRVSRVFVASDLNGDGKFSGNEMGSVKDGNTVSYGYSALTSAGKAQQIATLSSSSMKMTDKLALAFEFVGGYSDSSLTASSSVGENKFGSGSGQGDIRYTYYVQSKDTEKTKLNVFDSNINGSSSVGTIASMTEKFNSSYSKASALENEAASSASKLNGFTLSPDVIKANVQGTYTEDEVNYLTITLWDSTKGVLYGTNDEVSSTSNNVNYYSSFGGQWTALNIPLVMDLVDSASPKVKFESLSAADLGHVELSSSLPSSAFDSASSTGEFDRDDKISGSVIFKGSVSDEKKIKSLTLKSSKAINSSLTNAVTVAEYKNGSLVATTAASSTTGWKFTITDQTFTVAEGHTVSWQLELDSSYVAGVSASDVTFTLAASDGTNSNTNYTVKNGGLYDRNNSTVTDISANGAYRVDVVPYITAITRANTNISGGTMNRSYIGRYPVAEGETLKVAGYNLGTSGTWKVGSSNTNGGGYTAEKADGIYSFTMTVPERSGALSVTINSIASLNNSNNNAQKNNIENFKMSGTSTQYTASDDRYLSVWNLGNYFKNTSDGAEVLKPEMTADANGNMYAAWVAQSNSNVMFSYGISEDVIQVFRCYDQPSVYSSVSFDTKGTDTTYSGGANIGFIPEHQGSSGTFSNTAMASNAIIGGAATIQITKDYIKNKTNPKDGLSAKADGNPGLDLDSGGNKSAFYTLASYDMNRRLGSFEAPHTARFNQYLYNIWYDNVTEALKFSVTNVSEISKYEANVGAIVGWVVIDGGYTGQDRVHTFESSAGKVNNTLIEGGRFNHSATGTQQKDGGNNKSNNSGVAKYNDAIFLSSGYRNTDQRYMIVASDKKSLTYGNTNEYTYDSDITPKTGDTIALMENTSGNYQISLRTITVSGNTISWDEAPSHEIHSATIYTGNVNVVGGTDVENINNFTAASNQSSSAGSSASIDVMTNGYPVVAYYDATNSQLRLACASAVNPSLASQWTRVVPGVTCSGEVSLKVDGANNVHIMYNNEDGQMCYLFGKYNSVGSYTWSDEEVVDENGSLSYGSISVVYNGTTYVPSMTYLNKANTANGVKYAYRTVAPSVGSDGKVTSADWDFMIIPALGSGHYALKENKISLESSNNWKSTVATVLQNQLDASQPKTATPATVDSVIAYKTSKAYETAYLKKEAE